MKRILAIMALLVLVFTAAAVSESDYTYFPESEAYVGFWRSGDAELEIVHMLDDYNLFTCVVTEMTSASEGIRWIYDNCSYDDAGAALSSSGIGMKLSIVVDDAGELVSNEMIFDDGAAAFHLNDDGTLTWTDFEEAPGENERVFEKAPAYPESAYEGTWMCDRITLTIEKQDDGITCRVYWGSSASEATEWVYENCRYDEVIGGLSTFENGVRSDVVYGEDGNVVSSDVVYEDGAASFIINHNGKLIWTDYKEPAGFNETLFEKLPED